VAKTWEDIRSFRYSTMDPPPDWPSGVRPISQEGLGLLGIDPGNNKLYWDGKELLVRDRIVHLGKIELAIAFMAAVGMLGSFILQLGTIRGWWF
jgi:hypothetical protein